MRSLYVPLTPEALAALRRLALQELRSQRDEAAFLIVEGLERRNALPNRRPARLVAPESDDG